MCIFHIYRMRRDTGHLPWTHSTEWFLPPSLPDCQKLFFEIEFFLILIDNIDNNF